MSEHTPGPWVVDDNREGREGLVTVYGADGSAVTCTGDMEDCTARDLADARLIAAAPDLLAAIESEAVRRAYDAGLGASEWEAFLWPEARAAIAKARGE
jgi:hypothetical protein